MWGARFRSIERFVPGRLANLLHFDGNEYRFKTALEVRDLVTSGYLTGLSVDISKLPNNPTNQITALEEARSRLRKGGLMDYCWLRSQGNNRIYITCRMKDKASVKRAIESGFQAFIMPRWYCRAGVAPATFPTAPSPPSGRYPNPHRPPKIPKGILPSSLGSRGTSYPG